MIGKLRGTVDTWLEDAIILDVSGVGYLVHVSVKALDHLRDQGGEVRLFIETVVREDLIRLYGFISVAELGWFRLLTSVQGVGARTALALLSTLSPSDMANAVAFGDKAAFTRASGVGAKMAQRIINELKDKQPKHLNIAIGDSGAQSSSGELSKAEEAIHQSEVQDARSALINLGYPEQLASQAVMSAVQKSDGDLTTESLIKLALKDLMR